MTILGAWIAVGLTLFMFSFLYKDNPFYKFGESLYVGIALGYSLVRLWYQTWIDKVWEVLKSDASGKWWVLLPVAIGLLLLTRFVPKVSWLSRWAFAFLIGYGSGMAIPAILTTSIVKQAEATAKPLVSMPDKSEAAKKSVDGAKAAWDKAKAAEPTETDAVRATRIRYEEARSRTEYTFVTAYRDLTTLAIFIGVFSVLFYFFFSIEHKGPVRIFSRIGILFLMIYFGASYGNTAMGRFSLLYGRVLTLKKFGGGDYYYSTGILVVVMIGVLTALHFKNRGKEERA